MVEEEPQNSISIIDSLISTYQNEVSYELGEAFFGKGYAHFEISEYEESILAFQDALQIFKKIQDTCYQKRIFYNLGSSLNMVGDHLGASKYYLKSIEIENCKDFENSNAADHYNLAILFIDIGLTEDAIKQYQLAIATDSIGDNVTFRQLSKMGLALEQFYMDETYNAFNIYKNVLKQSVNDTVEYFTIFFYGYADLASMYATKNNLDSAYKYYNLAHQMALEDNIKDYLITDYLTKGEILIKEKEYDEAIKLSLKADSLSDEIGFFSNKITAIGQVANIYELKGDFRNAYRYLKQEKNMTDSAYNVHTKSTFLVQSLDQKNSQILKLSQAEELSKSKINTLKNSFYFFIGILIVLGIFLVFINKERKKIKGLNKNLNDLLDEKNRIMTVLSHDLRSPITALKGIIDLLKLNILSTEEKEKMIIKLESSINDLNSNLNTLLEWALTNKNNSKPTFKNVNVKKTIEKVFVFLRQQADQKSIKLSSLTSSDSLTTFVDENHLELIIRNILSNAIKFSHPNSEVELITTTENGKVKISIKDQGIGLSEKELNQIRAFKKLKRNGTNGEKGLGLGLQMVNFYTILNNGGIEIVSIKSEGTTFTLSFNLN